MRFACQSCGKAYNLPEERIADKSNVKLKCRVCGAIVEVKKQGELVAQVLDEADAKRIARVSEAPAPLTSITPEDDDADGATVSISEQSINEHGPLELEMPLLPPAAATGFAAAASSLAREASSARLEAGGLAGTSTANVAPPLPPPPLSPSSLPPPPALRGAEAAAEPVTNGSNGAAHGEANGAAGFFPEDAGAAPAAAPEELVPPVAPAAAAPANAMGMISDLSDVPASPGEAVGRDPMLKLKMAAAFVTGVLIDRILIGLFN